MLFDVYAYVIEGENYYDSALLLCTRACARFTDNLPQTLASHELLDIENNPDAETIAMQADSAHRISVRVPTAQPHCVDVFKEREAVSPSS